MDSTLATTNFARWAQALLTGDPGDVVSLYAEQMTLIPTMSEKVLRTHQEAKGYFTNFGSLQPRAEITEEDFVVPLSSESYLHCGLYRFTLGAKGDEVVDARFSMIWELHDGEWVIAHHHSSRLPKS